MEDELVEVDSSDAEVDFFLLDFGAFLRLSLFGIIGVSSIILNITKTLHGLRQVGVEIHCITCRKKNAMSNREVWRTRVSMVQATSPI